MKSHRQRTIHRSVLALVLAAAALPALALQAVPVVRGLVEPWSLAFLPDGRMLVTERAGRLRVVAADGRLGAPVTGLPPIDAGGQCGLLDVVPDPQFAQNRWIYWSYAEAGDGGNSTAVARGRLDADAGRVTDVMPVFVQRPKVRSSAHCGSRLVFARDGRLFVTLGDRFSRKDDAQDLGNHLGKIVRVEADGRVPADNPFVDQPGAAPEVWSLGHRNVQGAALHPATGELWADEHGPQGGDEVNRVLSGRNYGWPLVTYGRNYGSGTRIGEEGPKAGVEPPLHHWVPTSIAPSGMAFLTSDRYEARHPGWRGSVFVGALRAQVLVRLTLDGNRVVGEQRLLDGAALRVRDVRQGPDGWLYLVAGGAEGQVLRLEP
ncbi:MAG: PQQ-dependent sugar dehydrogenase [Rubrivivax sp.]